MKAAHKYDALPRLTLFRNVQTSKTINPKQLALKSKIATKYFTRFGFSLESQSLFICRYLSGYYHQIYHFSPLEYGCCTEEKNPLFLLL
jgi:hypothetical protein